MEDPEHGSPEAQALQAARSHRARAPADDEGEAELQPRQVGGQGRLLTRCFPDAPPPAQGTTAVAE